MKDYSWKNVMAALEERLDACTGVDWSDVQDKLRAQFDWEFEGMR